MFAVRTVKPVILDDEDQKVTVIVRKLSADQLEKAAEVKMLAGLRQVREMGVDLMKASQERAQAQEQVRTKYDRFDRKTTLGFGVKEWDAKADGQPRPLTDISELDEESADLLFHTIVDMSVRDHDKAEQGKD